jgi:short-subunit dehydrogenase
VKDLRGRTALLTGASGGLGPYIARRLHGEGVHLTLSARNEEALKELARELDDARDITADLGSARDVERLARAAAEIDSLVAAAAQTAAGELDVVGPDEIVRTLAVNLQAPMLLTKYLLPGMRSRGEGHIVLLASIAGKIASPDYPVYSTTKFGLRGFALALRPALRGTGVGLSLVSPTFVSEAGMWAVTGRRAHPLAGETSPADVADAVVKAIKSNRVEVNVMPLATHISSRLAGALPELVMEVGDRTGGSRVPNDALARQREKEAVANRENRK